MSTQKIPIRSVIFSKIRAFFFCLFWGGLVLGVGHLILDDIKNQYDLYKNGKITDGVVISVEQKQERRGRKKHRRNVTVYEHLVTYDDFEKKFTYDNAVPINSIVRVYYSPLNPTKAILQTERHPYTSVQDIIDNKINEPLVIAQAVFCLFFLLSFYQLVKGP